MKTLLTSFILTLALSVNAYAYQVADSRYEGTYNSIDLNTAQTAFNGIRSRGAGGGAPVGTIVAVPSDAEAKFIEEDPDAWVLCDGREVPSGTALRSYMTHTPNLNGEKRFLQGTTGTSGTIAAGLPNITSWFDIDDNWDVGGAMYKSGAGKGLEAKYDWVASRAYFNASRSSPVYGRSNTVQPEAYTVRYYIRCNE